MRILLVEDEPHVMSINRQYIEELGYEVLCAESINEARAYLWETPPDLIVLDVILPDGSGYDFCTEIRKISAAPVIYLTCKGEDRHIVTGLERGGDDYIIKPYSLDVLGARIAAQLRRHGHGVGEILFPPLYINLGTGTVLMDGQNVPLAPKEMQLLAYLVEHRGEELFPEQIYQAVWGGPPETMGNTVKVHISRLRQKLELDNSLSLDLSPTLNQGYVFLRTVYST